LDGDEVALEARQVERSLAGSVLLVHRYVGRLDQRTHQLLDLLW
jgi:hypothetical protein